MHRRENLRDFEKQNQTGKQFQIKRGDIGDWTVNQARRLN